MSRSTLAKLGLALASTVLTLLAVEVAARVMVARTDLGARLARGPAVRAPGAELELVDFIELDADPRIVFRLIPRMRGTYLGLPLAINALGQRGPEVARAKEPGVLRVVGLGDSVAFGWGVRQEETYLARLGERLGASGLRVEVVNLGVPGYNTIQEIAAFERDGLALDPDVVVLGINENDLDLPMFLWADAHGGVWSLRRSFALELLRASLGIPPVRESDVSPPALSVFSDRLKVDGAGAAPGDEEKPPIALAPLVGKDNFLAALDRLRDLAREHGFQVIALPYFPQRGKVGPGDSLPYFTIPGTAGYLLDFFLDACRARGFTVVDPEERFVRARRERKLGDKALWVAPHDSHPNALGHRLIGEALEAPVRAALRGAGQGTAAAAGPAGAPRPAAPPAS